MAISIRYHLSNREFSRERYSIFVLANNFPFYYASEDRYYSHKTDCVFSVVHEQRTAWICQVEKRYIKNGFYFFDSTTFRYSEFQHRREWDMWYSNFSAWVFMLIDEGFMEINFSSDIYPINKVMKTSTKKRGLWKYKYMTTV